MVSEDLYRAVVDALVGIMRLEGSKSSKSRSGKQWAVTLAPGCEAYRRMEVLFPNLVGVERAWFDACQIAGPIIDARTFEEYKRQEAIDTANREARIEAVAKLNDIGKRLKTLLKKEAAERAEEERLKLIEDERKRREQQGWSKMAPLRSRLKKYGLSIPQYEDMLSKQGGCCANTACRKTAAQSGKKGLSIDHCHKTQKVRGLLCHACNVALGFTRDQPEVIKGLAEYLKSST